MAIFKKTYYSVELNDYWYCPKTKSWIHSDDTSKVPGNKQSNRTFKTFDKVRREIDRICKHIPAGTGIMITKFFVPSARRKGKIDYIYAHNVFTGVI